MQQGGGLIASKGSVMKLVVCLSEDAQMQHALLLLV